jgi:hypothetical protein
MNNIGIVMTKIKGIYKCHDYEDYYLWFNNEKKDPTKPSQLTVKEMKDGKVYEVRVFMKTQNAKKEHYHSDVYLRIGGDRQKYTIVTMFGEGHDPHERDTWLLIRETKDQFYKMSSREEYLYTKDKFMMAMGNPEEEPQ